MYHANLLVFILVMALSSCSTNKTICKGNKTSKSVSKAGLYGNKTYCKPTKMKK